MRRHEDDRASASHGVSNQLFRFFVRMHVLKHGFHRTVPNPDAFHRLAPGIAADAGKNAFMRVSGRAEIGARTPAIPRRKPENEFTDEGAEKLQERQRKFGNERE